MPERIVILVACITTLVGCSSGSLPSSSSEAYTEDLSGLRPELGMAEDSSEVISRPQTENVDYEVIIPTNDVTAQLNTVLDSIVSLRSDIKYVDGFTILVYSGTNSEQARIAKGRIYSLIPGAQPILKYDEPNFRVKVGKYYSRLEAQKDYAALKKKFSKAIIIPERIYIN